ncbi:hypothetical protein U5B43_04730 [Campylobacter sp. 9BO]|uniref:hypothetical protein n=1 Tax=Campylobacter sp. 9BO TaxID=3424759 RepID=UPI003D3427A1
MEKFIKNLILFVYLRALDSVVLKKHIKVIASKDELIISSYFLIFINEALKVYKKRHNIMRVSFYAYLVNLNDSYKYFCQIILNKKNWITFWCASIYLCDGLLLNLKYGYTKNVVIYNFGISCCNLSALDARLFKNYNFNFLSKIIEVQNARSF